MFLDIVSVAIIYVSMNACATKKQDGVKFEDSINPGGLEESTVDSPSTLYSRTL
jgi:hypothetical protein